ncbi:FxLYD domain-containing protein [Streptomyces sp. NPDC090106]|uniref:FxLYD domain-containing protein n=1 Tax=Streptomyces sp. NPDC090106 TaxID=3365946 RepID=UPI0037FF1122
MSQPTHRRRIATALTGLVLTAVSAASLVACGDDDSSSSSDATRSAAVTASFSGSAPSALASVKESVKESVTAAASSAAASVSARASEWLASVDANTERSRQAAQDALEDVDGKGNATADVSLTGKPRSETSGFLAVVVTIRNSTDDTASYAVQVDFRDADGKVVETRYVGAEDLAAGAKVQPLAISHDSDGTQLTAVVTKAQRY